MREARLIGFQLLNSEHMKTTKIVIILILGLVLPQSKEALVVPFSNSRYSGSRTTTPTVSIKPATDQRDETLEIPKNEAEQKYQEELKKILLILNRPKFIYKLLWSYQKNLAKVKECSI